MNLTQEQLHIIELSKNLKPNEILSIQACAGSGKTYTLKQIALANSNKRFLYLAFNKAIVVESKGKFPKNVEVKTLHSLALSYAKRKLGDFKLIPNINIFDLQKVFLVRNDQLILALKGFNDFLKSDEPLESQPDFIKEFYQAVLNKELPMFHNFYLKYYALAKDKNLEKEYDCVLLDEAQDTNATMLEIFLQNHCAKVLVGDSFQNIYGFNHSLNAFQIINPTHKTTLSKSFRCNQEIINYANFFLQNFTNQSFTKLESYCNENISPKNKAIITRTNAGIIEFINEIENEAEYALLKEPDKIFAPLYAIIHFKNAKFDLIPQEYNYFKNFSTTKELYEYINKCQDKELLSALNLLNKGFNIYEISKKAKRLFYNKKAKNFIINAHQAKGLEWDSVEIYNDFSSLKDLQEDLRKETDKKKKQELYLSLEQERNLFYVAITRARSLLMDTSKNRIFYSNQND